MPSFKHRQISFMLICLFLFTFITACSNNGTGTNVSTPPNRLTTSTPAQPTPTATPVLVTSTTCPAPSTDRAAVMPSLQPGANENIVYLGGYSDAASQNSQL